uniref:Homing endonuclease LAGLIDADG domain-containing protein n=1 Tax=Blidingia minima TaxID=63414 RepID=A0A8E5N7V9_9CHLO|nr:hypothetical protein [Blidingia minima]
MIKNDKKLNLTEIEVAWLSGLFEGEGSFGIDNRSAKRYINSVAPAAPFIKIAMTDEDVIAKVAKLLNKSHLSPTRKTVTNKTVFICHIGDRQTLLYLLPRMLPYMGKRRQKQIQMSIFLLNKWKIWKNKRN